MPLIGRLVINHQHEKALKFLIQYHGSGMCTTIVQREYDQIVATAKPLPRSIKDRWSIKGLTGRKGDGHRVFLGAYDTMFLLMCAAIITGVFANMSGGGLFAFVSYVGHRAVCFPP